MAPKKESTSSNYRRRSNGLDDALRRFVRRPEMRTLIQSKAILLSYSPLIGFAILAPAVVAVVFVAVVVVVVVVVDVVGATRNGISGRYAAHGIGLPRDLIR